MKIVYVYAKLLIKIFMGQNIEYHHLTLQSNWYLKTHSFIKYKPYSCGNLRSNDCSLFLRIFCLYVHIHMKRAHFFVLTLYLVPEATSWDDLWDFFPQEGNLSCMNYAWHVFCVLLCHGKKRNYV